MSFWCTQFLTRAVLLRVNSFAHCSAEINARSLAHTFLMHTGLMHSVWLRYPTTRLLYSYIISVTTLVLHYYTTATLLPLCYTTATCYYTLWLHYDTIAILHLHCESTRTRNTLHYHTLFHTTATLLPHYCHALLLHTLCTTLCTTAPTLHYALHYSAAVCA